MFASPSHDNFYASHHYVPATSDEAVVYRNSVSATSPRLTGYLLYVRFYLRDYAHLGML